MSLLFKNIFFNKRRQFKIIMNILSLNIDEKNKFNQTNKKNSFKKRSMNMAPRTYGFYNRLLNIRVSYLYCATIASIALCTAGWWYFLYKPVVANSNAMQQQLNQMYAQIDELRKSERTLLGISKSIDALKQNVQKNSEPKNRKQYAQQNLSSIAEFATNAGVTIASCRVCAQRDESWCCVNDIAGDFKGSFEQMIAFFDSLKNTKQLIDVSKCELVRVDAITFSLHATFSFYCI